MNHPVRRQTWAALVGGGLMLVTLACLCGPIQQIQTFQATAGPALTAVKQDQPTFQALATQIQLTLTASGPEMTGVFGQLNTAVSGTETRQWAANAGGSSQRSPGDFSFSQITGLPNTTTCGDNPTAWASDPNEKKPILTVDYATAVIPTQIIIHHTFNPGAVVEVNVDNADGSKNVVVYQGSAAKIAQCPYEQTISVTPGTVTFPATEIVISLDQSSMPGQDEIDAVELVGIAQ